MIEITPEVEGCVEFYCDYREWAGINAIVKQALETYNDLEIDSVISQYDLNRLHQHLNSEGDVPILLSSNQLRGLFAVISRTETMEVTDLDDLLHFSLVSQIDEMDLTVYLGQNHSGYDGDCCDM